MIDKSAVKREFKQSVVPKGIFQIKNLKTGKIFVGSSQNLSTEFNSQRFRLSRNLCSERELQQDYAALGESQFAFEVLDTLEPKEDPVYDCTGDLKVLEEMWLEKLQPFGDAGYNKKRK